MKKIITLIISALITCMAISQDYNPQRYQSNIFPNINTNNNIQYGSSPQWVWPYWYEDLFLNIYEPSGDVNQKRPLIILAHSGGFFNGSKDVDDMVALCDSFAQKGFVTATIDYRKGFDPLDGESAERAVYRGIQDGKTAVRYFKTNADLYNIDTNYVFFGGMSAGAFIALHIGYMDKELERPVSTYGGFTVNDLGCLDCGDHQGVTSNVKGILDYWGAVQDTSIIENNGPPILIMHGENDPTVPFVYGHPFGVSTIPNVFGSQNIKIKCDIESIPNTFITSAGPLHMLDGSNNGTWDPAPNSFWSDTLLPETKEFIYQLIKPNTSFISPQEVTICIGASNVFEVSNGVNSHYIWEFDNNNIDVVNNSNFNTIELQFTTIGTYTINVVEFNEILCAGDTLTYDVNVEPLPISNFGFSVSNAFDISFTNTTINGDSYYWDFGDGSNSIEENPTHIYTQEGDYLVSLITTSTDGCVSEVYSEIITISTANLNELETNLIVTSPFHDKLNLNSDVPLNEVTVYSIDGKIVYYNQKVEVSTNIFTMDWNKGLYILNFIDVNGTNQQLKLVKL
jgi:acetyl esterase/lipase/PKD repeat protein